MAWIALDIIKTDGGTQSRAMIDQHVVTEYAHAIRDGATLPPVIVFYDGTDHWLADGFHRVEAGFYLDLKEIEADIRQGTRRDAVLYSVGANAAHGLRRTNADKRRAVETLLRDEEWGAWSNSKIARACGVDDKTVAATRMDLSSEIPKMETRKVERNGIVYEQNTANIGKRVEPPSRTETGEPIVRRDDPAAVARVTAVLKKPSAPPPTPNEVDPWERIIDSRAALVAALASQDQAEKNRAIEMAVRAIDGVTGARKGA